MRMVATIALIACLGVLPPILIAGSATAASRPDQPQPSAGTVKKCPKGTIWNKKKKKCVKTESGVIPDRDLLAQATLLARSGEYEWAIAILSVVRDKSDPEVLNMFGYSHRKAGRLETGIAYYRKALAIDPDYVLAREYLGEGLVSAGRLDLARAELAEIAVRCGTTCEEYIDLKETIGAAAP